jgi:CheY-like chemotaxis protein
MGETEANETPRTILVVEDDADFGGLVRLKLEAAGHEVRVVSSSQQALAAVAENSPGLILLDLILADEDGGEALNYLRGGDTVDLVSSDVVMPKVGGRELLEQARKFQPGLVFLFSSGSTDASLRDLLDTDDATSFIAKPYSVTRLASTLRCALTRED